MGSIAVEPRAAQPPPRYWTVARGLLVGLIFGALCLVLVEMVAVLAGLTGNEWTTHESRGALGSPYPRGGLWSVAANLAVGLGACVVVGWCIWDRVERKARQPVSMSRIVLIVLFAGYAPYLAGAPGGWFVALFFVAAFLIRRFAVGAPPLGWWSPRTRRLLLIGMGALALVPASYGSVHPLWYGAEASSEGTTNWADHRVVFTPARDRLVKVRFSIHNQGRFSVRVAGVTGGTPNIRVVRVFGSWWPRDSGARPLRNAVLHPGDEQPLTLLLALRRCTSSSPRLDTLDRVTAHYRLLGKAFAQPIALAIRPTISC